MQQKLLLGVLVVAGIMSVTAFSYAKTKTSAAKRAGVSVSQPAKAPAKSKIKSTNPKKTTAPKKSAKSATKVTTAATKTAPAARAKAKSKTKKLAIKPKKTSAKATAKPKKVAKASTRPKKSKAAKPSPTASAPPSLDDPGDPGYQMTLPLGDNSALNISGADAVLLQQDPLQACAQVGT